MFSPCFLLTLHSVLRLQFIHKVTFIHIQSNSQAVSTIVSLQTIKNEILVHVFRNAKEKFIHEFQRET